VAEVWNGVRSHGAKTKFARQVHRWWVAWTRLPGINAKTKLQYAAVLKLKRQKSVYKQYWIKYHSGLVSHSGCNFLWLATLAFGVEGQVIVAIVFCVTNAMLTWSLFSIWIYYL
jgi:hypothetical protein